MNRKGAKKEKREKNEYLPKRKRINFNTRHNLSQGVRELSIIVVFVWHVTKVPKHASIHVKFECDTPQRKWM